MSILSLDLVLDISTGKLVRNFTSAAPVPQLLAYRSDSLDIRLRTVYPSGTSDYPFVDYPISASTAVELAIGIPGQDFTSGEIVLTFDGESATIENPKPTIEEVDAALSEMSTIQTYGGVTVIGEDGGPYRVVFNQIGNPPTISVNTDKMFPAGSATVDVYRAGGVSVAEIQDIYLEVDKFCFSDDFEDWDGEDPTITEITDGGTGSNEVQRLDFSLAEVYGGSYQLSFKGPTQLVTYRTALIEWDADAETIQAALGEHPHIGASNVSVTGEYPFFVIEFISALAEESQNLITIVTDTLNMPVAKLFTMDTNTFSMRDALKNGGSVSAILEITIDDKTLCQSEITIKEDIINNASPTA